MSLCVCIYTYTYYICMCINWIEKLSNSTVKYCPITFLALGWIWAECIANVHFCTCAPITCTSVTDVWQMLCYASDHKLLLFFYNLIFVCPKYFSQNCTDSFRCFLGAWPGLPVPIPQYFHLLVIDLGGDTPGSSRLSYTWLDVITLFLLTM